MFLPLIMSRLDEQNQIFGINGTVLQHFGCMSALRVANNKNFCMFFLVVRTNHKAFVFKTSLCWSDTGTILIDTCSITQPTGKTKQCLHFCADDIQLYMFLSLMYVFCLSQISDWLSNSYIVFNSNKTRAMIIEPWLSYIQESVKWFFPLLHLRSILFDSSLGFA